MKKLFCLVLLLLPVQTLLAQSVGQLLADGNKAYQAKDYPTAEKSYRAATQLDPRSLSAYQGLANCEYMEGRKTEALADYKKVLELNPQSPGVAKMVQSLEAQAIQGPGLQTKPMSDSAHEDAWAGKRFQFGGFAGLVVTSFASSSGVTMGVAGEGNFFYLFDPNWAVGISADIQDFSTRFDTILGFGGNQVETFQKISYLNVLAEGKYRFEGAKFRPYLLAGAGLDMLTVHSRVLESAAPTFVFTEIASGTVTGSYPVVEGGLGFDLALFTPLCLSLETKYQLILSQGGTNFLVPIHGGLSVLF